MISYYGYTISPNQIETGEGFLICRNVPIARTGDQEYLGREIGLDSDKIVTVHRLPEEVFSKEALASFEGKPVSDDHPPKLLDPDNASIYLKGHAQNVRQGSGDWDGYVIADLHIQDGALIDKIQHGKREISCGYECEYINNGDGTYSQKNIRGNHIAVVERGRAGKRAAILDSDRTKKQADTSRPERKNMKKNGLFLKLFGMSVKDKSPEEIEQMAQDAADALEEAGPVQTPGKMPPEGKEGAKDGMEPGSAGGNQEELIETVVSRVLAVLTQKQEPAKADPFDEAIEKLTGKQPGETKEEAKVVPAEEKPSMDAAVVAEILKKVRPAVVAIQDEKQRKAVADALIASVTDQEGDIAKILQTVQKNAQKAADSSQKMDADAIQKEYDKFNPHRKEQQ